MTLEEILAVEDISKKISLLKAHRKTSLPKVKELLDEWDPDRHDVMNPSIRKKRKVLVSEAEVGENGKIIKPAVYQEEDVNRVALPIEQDIVNIHTAFTVGKDPKLNYKANNQSEDDLYSVIQTINRDNKIRYQNKRIVRSWFSEKEAVEYWYEKRDLGFWEKIAAKIRKLFGNTKPFNKLRCAIWSPFRGDTLYPFYDETGDYVAQSRAYTVTEYTLDGRKRINYFQTVTNNSVFVWRQENNVWSLDKTKSFDHHFPKIPCLYIEREQSLCHKIKSLRARLEKLLSDYGDCIDYHFFPYLILEGEIAGEAGLGNQDERRRMLKIEEDGKAYYLTWDQTPESIKLEITTLLENIYGMTSTPRITFENMKSLGQMASGIAFKYMFMSTLLAVDNHAETVGEFLQRRYNFLVSAVGSICPALKKAADSIEITVEIEPYSIENIKEKLEIAKMAKDASFMSRKSGIIFIGMTDQVEEEIKQIDKEQSESAEKQPAEKKEKRQMNR
ncbi:MAG: phage portal protein [Bacteroidales bacterium]|nr:phage portal protein [Bacteroidales bacterium]